MPKDVSRKNSERDKGLKDFCYRSWGRTGFDGGMESGVASGGFSLGSALKNWGIKDKRKRKLRFSSLI